MKLLITIFLKELKDTLRDRRTLLIMLVVPFLVIPVLLSLTTSFTANQANKAQTQTIRLSIFSEGAGEELINQYKLRKDLVIRNDIPEKQINDYIKNDSVDLALFIDENFDADVANGKTGTILVKMGTSSDSIILKRTLSTINYYEKKILQNRLDSLGATFETINPIQLKARNVNSQRESIAKLAGGILPYFFVLFCLFGAMYPAIDLFTGEKERGTIETILSVPASRLQLLVGKMGVVVLAGLVSGFLTILGLYLGAQLNPEMPGFIKGLVTNLLNPWAMSLLLLLMIPLTIFFAGLLIFVTVYAKSFKEAQSIIQPLTFVAIFPLLMGLWPGIKLTFGTALIPVLNIALATREIIAGTINWGLFAVVFLSLITFAALAVFLCIKRFGDERNILRT